MLVSEFKKFLETKSGGIKIAPPPNYFFLMESEFPERKINDYIDNCIRKLFPEESWAGCEDGRDISFAAVNEILENLSRQKRLKNLIKKEYGDIGDFNKFLMEKIFSVAPKYDDYPCFCVVTGDFLPSQTSQSFFDEIKNIDYISDRAAFAILHENQTETVYKNLFKK